MKYYNKAHEKSFEAELRHMAALCKCAYFKIPDVKPTKEKLKDRKNYLMTEEKRPYDSNLVTPNGIYAIECKYNYNSLEPHQKANLEEINRICPGTGWVLRKIEKFDETGYRRVYVKYRKEMNGEIVLETEDPLDLIKSFLA